MNGARNDRCGLKCWVAIIAALIVLLSVGLFYYLRMSVRLDAPLNRVSAATSATIRETTAHLCHRKTHGA